MKPLILLLLATTATPAQAFCPRALLQNATTLLLSAQTSGTPRTLPFSPNAAYTENDVPLPLTSSILTHPLTIDHHLSLHDTTQCATFTEMIAATNPHPYVIMTRMLFEETQVQAASKTPTSDPSLRITCIQSIVADAGDWLFNASSSLRWASSEPWTPIPPSQLDTRTAIRAAGDAYLDSWGDGRVSVPYGTPCARLEGGAYTADRNATANTCYMPEFPKPFRITNRRYVVDEVMGAVDVFHDFPFIDRGRPEGTPSTNLVRVERGRIRFVHEVTVCKGWDCGR